MALAALLFVTSSVAAEDIRPDIRANQYDHDLVVLPGEPVGIAVTLDVGTSAGTEADWWAASYSSGTWYSITGTGTWAKGLMPAFHAPLFSFGTPVEILSATLAEGPHSFFFAVSVPADATPEALWYDSVDIEVSRAACDTTEDCACGVDINTRECAVGNQRFIDTSTQCPDFCTGIGGNLITACLDHRCTQVAPQCSTDADCFRRGCSGEVCTNDPYLATDCIRQDHFVCFGKDYTSCGCADGICRFAETPEFSQCLEDFGVF
jgi:eight-cysteine-cluster-containing protein